MTTMPDTLERETFAPPAQAEAPAPATGAGNPVWPRRLWRALWPPLSAVTLGLGLWQLVALSGWRPSYLLPGPLPVLRRVLEEARSGTLFTAAGVMLQRAAIGYALALLIGTGIGLLIARGRMLRAATASLILGLQSMPSVAWFPLAILLFQLSERAIVFVVVLGAAPSIANGLLAAFDHVPPALLRAARVLGARGPRLYWHVLLPAALPDFVSGMKQAWAFAWRSLLAGELLVIVAHRPSIGAQLQFARDFSDAEGLLAWMLVILIIGIVVEALIFTPIMRRIRAHRGLIDAGAR